MKSRNRQIPIAFVHFSVLLWHFSVLLWLFLFLIPRHLFAQSGNSTRIVDEIVLEGNRLIDRDAISSQIDLTPGALEAQSISEQVKSLYETGFFDQIYARYETTQSGKRLLVFQFTEKPIVRKIFITGNDEIDEKDLAKVFQFEGRRFLDLSTIQLLIRNGEAFYQSRGYFNAELSHNVTPVGDNQVDITFIVTEGERFAIREIELRGLEEVDEDDLYDVMQTKEYHWWSSWILGTGRLSEDMLKNDRQLIRQYFLDHGYLDASISEPSVQLRDGGIYISFDVEEGELYSVGSIGVSGDLIEESEEKTLEDIELEEGETFRADDMREDVFRITEKFTDQGYAFANVVPGTKINPNTRQVAIVFQTDKGKEVSINRIQINGNTKTYDNVIRRELRVAEGDKFSSGKIRRSEQLLQRLGYFEEASIATETIEGNTDEVDLNVNVREAATGTFSAGAGYSTAEGTLFNARLSENNVLGTGRRLSLNADLGRLRQNFILSLQDRRFQDSFWSVGMQALITERNFVDFDRELNGGSFSVGYPLEEIGPEWMQDMNFGVEYQYLDITISNVDEDDAAQLVIDSEGDSSSSSVTPRLTRNTINNPLNPTDGSRQSVSVELAGLGGTEEFFLVEALHQMYVPLVRFDESGEVTFSYRVRFGYGEATDDDTFPLFRRYFPGGINSVRGFNARTLGPKDEDGNEFGGSKQLVNNIELIFPLLRSAGLRGVVFFDAGEAFDDDETIKLGDLRQAWGYGIRWASPLGPIRVEFGVPIDREEGEDSLVTLFSFGAPL